MATPPAPRALRALTLSPTPPPPPLPHTAPDALPPLVRALLPCLPPRVGGTGDDDDREDEDLFDTSISLDDYAQAVDGDQTLSDHPEVQLSPVVLYQIKKAKEEMRKNARRLALLAEGLTEDEINERMEMDALTGGGGAGRQNALALLIQHGARVAPSAGGADADNVALQDRRRLQRNVDTFLFKTDGIEKMRLEQQAGYKQGREGGGKMKSAHEMAKETSITPYGGESYVRELRQLTHAKQARNLYREWQKVHKPEQGTERSDGRRDGLLTSTAERRGGGLSDLDMLAQIQAEFDGEGEEGDEGDEGADDGGDDDDEEELDA